MRETDKLLLHAARQLADLTLLGRRQVAEGEEFIDPCRAFPALHAIEVGVDVDILYHGEVRIEPEALAHISIDWHSTNHTLRHGNAVGDAVTRVENQPIAG